MSRKDIIINDDIHGTLEIYGVVYHQEAFRQLASQQLIGRAIRFVPTPEKFHGEAMSIELVDEGLDAWT